MTARRKSLAAWWWAAGVALLIVANVFVAIRNAGTRAGQTYRWVCPETGASLTYDSSVLGSARLTTSRGPLPDGVYTWELVDPAPLSPKPWNWLAILLEKSPPDPEELLR